MIFPRVAHFDVMERARPAYGPESRESIGPPLRIDFSYWQASFPFLRKERTDNGPESRESVGPPCS